MFSIKLNTTSWIVYRRDLLEMIQKIQPNKKLVTYGRNETHYNYKLTTITLILQVLKNLSLLWWAVRKESMKKRFI